MSALYLILIFAAVVLFMPPPQRRYGWVRRQRSAREEAMHDKIQQAMNWSPDHFYQREDGRWFNAYGQEGVRMSLEELMKREESAKDKRDG